jgi:hypothetical protein
VGIEVGQHMDAPWVAALAGRAVNGKCRSSIRGANG